MKNNATDHQVVINHNESVIDIDFDITTYVLSICNYLNTDFNHIEITFLTKETITTMNNEYFNAEVPTDTISFNLTPEELITGDIYICPEVIQDNATQYKLSFEHELKIVLIHSVLHLIGHEDDTDENFEKMTALQNKIYEELNS